MSDETQAQITEPVEAEKPKRGGWPKGKKRGPGKRHLRVVETKPADEFPGLSPTECCDDCRMEKCVITGLGLCGHPLKGGLQPALMMRPDVVNRFTRAKKVLAHAKIDLMGQ